MIVFTQDERVYLPGAVRVVVGAMPERITCIVLSPPMSTHGGLVKGLLRHLPVFGVKGTMIMGTRVVASRLGPLLGLKPRYCDDWSIESIGKRFGIPTYRIERVNSPAMHAILDRHPAELLASISCPQIIRRKLLRRFPRGGINVHSAPLPRYRGLMPGFWVLYHDEPSTAVTVHDLAEKLDNGDILVQQPVDVAPGETWDSLVRKTKLAAGHALVEAIRQLEAGTATRRPNPDSESTYFSFPTARDARDFRARGHSMF